MGRDLVTLCVQSGFTTGKFLFSKTLVSVPVCVMDFIMTRISGFLIRTRFELGVRIRIRIWDLLHVRIRIHIRTGFARHPPRGVSELDCTTTSDVVRVLHYRDTYPHPYTYTYTVTDPSEFGFVFIFETGICHRITLFIINVERESYRQNL